MHEVSVEFWLLNYQWFHQVRSNIACPTIYIQYLDLLEHHWTFTFFLVEYEQKPQNQSKHPVFTASSKIEVRMAMQLHTLTVSKVHPKVPSKAQMRLAGMDKQRPGRSIPWQAGNKIPSFSIGKKYESIESSKGIIFHLQLCFFLPELSDPIWNGFILDQTNGTMPCIASELATKSCLYNG